jgi:hypothetical protein
VVSHDEGESPSDGLWGVIESRAGDYYDDQTALTAILHAVPPEMQAGPALKPTATESWEAIHKVRISADCVKEANAERLRREFADLAFKPGEDGRFFCCA